MSNEPQEEYRGYTFRLRHSGAYKNQWDFWLHNPEGHQMADLFHSLLQPGRSGIVHGRNGKWAARQVRKLIDQTIDAKERRFTEARANRATFKSITSATKAIDRFLEFQGHLNNNQVRRLLEGSP